MTDPAPIRSAATLVLWRMQADGPAVLMGQRGAKAAFMPSKHVFPGGAVDAGDTAPAGIMSDLCRARLTLDTLPDAPAPEAIAGAALRELAEEAGLRLNPSALGSGAVAGQPPLRFIFRAITPQGAPRRFDARFFLAPATALAGDVDDFSAAEDELSHLHWIPLAEVRRLDLPFITEIVLSEVGAILKDAVQPGVPFFDNRSPQSQFRRLLG